jgi:hypothetical protein
MLCEHDSFQNSEISVKWDNWNYPNLIYNPQRNTEHQEGEDGGAEHDAVPTERGKTVVGLHCMKDTVLVVILLIQIYRKIKNERIPGDLLEQSWG